MPSIGMGRAVLPLGNEDVTLFKGNGSAAMLTVSRNRADIIRDDIDGSTQVDSSNSIISYNGKIRLDSFKIVISNG
jgi:hypothetical protein